MADNTLDGVLASMYLSDVAETAKNLAFKIRKYVSLQSDIWRKIPELALDAAGRSASMQSILESAYMRSLWPIWLPGVADPLYIDLATARVMDADDPSTPASEGSLVMLLYVMDDLDASRIVELIQYMQHAPLNPEMTHLHSEEKNDLRRSLGERIDQARRTLDAT